MPRAALLACPLLENRLHQCRSCHHIKTLDGYSARCKECVNASRREAWAEEPERHAEYGRRYHESNPGSKWSSYLWTSYRLRPEQYDTIAESQGGGCAICGGQEPGRRLSVDHDHSCCDGKRSCGKCVRGLLCGDCNRALGLLKDDRSRLEAAMAYLDSPLAVQAGLTL